MEEEKKDVRKVIKWGGWKRELPWILFLIGLLIAGYGYWDLRQRHFELLDAECVWNCMAEEYIENVKEEYPTAVVNCDYETKRCLTSGTKIPKKFEVNISKLNWDSLNE